MLNSFLKAVVAVVLLASAYIIYLGFSNKGGELTTVVYIDAPMEAVFDYLVKPELSKKWLDGMKEITLIEGSEMQPGSKYRIVFEENGREIPMTETIVRYVENERFTFDLETDMVSANVDIFLYPEGGQTRVTEVNTYRGNSFMARAMTGMFKRSQKLRQQAMYDKLKTVVEREWEMD